MLIYHTDLHLYEYRTLNSNLFCFDFAGIKEQIAKIYNINVYSFLN